MKSIELEGHAQTITIQLRVVQDSYKGKHVRMKSGRYAGREAVIDGVMYDEYHGCFMFCCMVLRLRGKPGEYLNSDGESRRYWRREDFEVL